MSTHGKKDEKPSNVVELSLPEHKNAKKKKGSHGLRNAIIAVMLVLIPVAALILSDDIAVARIKKYFAGVFGNAAAIELGDGSELSFVFDSDAKSVYAMPRDHVAALSTTRFAIMSMDGETSASVAASFLSPAMDASGEFTLCYDRGGTIVLLFRGAEEVFRMNTERPIISACVNSSGGFAVATEDDDRKSLLSVYDEDFLVRYNFKSSANYIEDVDMWSDGRLAVYTLNADSGQFVSRVLFPDTSSEELPEESVFSGEFFFSISCLDGGDLLAVSDSGAVFIKPDGSHTYYDYGGRILQMYSVGSGGHTALLLENHLVGNNYDLVVLDGGGTEVFVKEINMEVKSVAAGVDKVAVLSSDRLLIYDVYGNALGERDAKREARKVLLDEWGRLGLFAPGSAEIYGFG